MTTLVSNTVLLTRHGQEMELIPWIPNETIHLLEESPQPGELFTAPNVPDPLKSTIPEDVNYLMRILSSSEKKLPLLYHLCCCLIPFEMFLRWKCYPSKSTRNILKWFAPLFTNGLQVVLLGLVSLGAHDDPLLANLSDVLVERSRLTLGKELGKGQPIYTFLILHCW